MTIDQLNNATLIFAVTVYVSTLLVCLAAAWVAVRSRPMTKDEEGEECLRRR